MEIVTLASRPDPAPKLWDLLSVWPKFMRHDPVADLCYDNIESRWSDWTLVAIDGDHIAARSFCVTFAMGVDIERPTLPSNGWDGVIRWSCLDSLEGREPTAVSALEIAVDPVYRGTGIAADMVRAMRNNASRHGFGELVAPVRPSRKHLEPETPNRYARQGCHPFHTRYESDRIHLRDRKSQNQSHERCQEPSPRPGEGLQAHRCHPRTVAQGQQPRTRRPGASRHRIRRRKPNRKKDRQHKGRRLTTRPNPQDLAIRRRERPEPTAPQWIQAVGDTGIEPVTSAV